MGVARELWVKQETIDSCENASRSLPTSSPFTIRSFHLYFLFFAFFRLATSHLSIKSASRSSCSPTIGGCAGLTSSEPRIRVTGGESDWNCGESDRPNATTNTRQNRRTVGVALECLHFQSADSVIVVARSKASGIPFLFRWGEAAYCCPASAPTAAECAPTAQQQQQQQQQQHGQQQRHSQPVRVRTL